MICLFFWASAAAFAQSGNADLLSGVNADLPPWLRLSGEYRIRAEGYEGGSYTAGNNQGYLLSRLQLNVDVRYGWFRTFAQTEDARVLGNDAIPNTFPYQDTFDLRQAFIEVGHSETGHVAFRVGRQELNFGDQRILGSANWLNTPRSFDAVRADVVYGKVRLDAFSASVVNVNANSAIDHSKPGNDLHGLYATLSNMLPGATIEPYALWHLGGGLKTEQGLAARRSVGTAAIRIARPPKGPFEYELHLLRQFGTIGNNTVSAYAMNFEAGWKWAGTLMQPRIFADYAYASGDRHPKDDRINTFDQIYPSNHGLYGVVDLFGWQNLRDEKFGVELKPAKKIVLSTIFHNLNLASATDALYNGAGNPVVRKPAGSAGTHIGEEWEGTAVYAPAKVVSSGVGYGHLFPGEFIRQATKSSSYNISYLFITYAF